MLYTPTAKPSTMPALVSTGADADEAGGLSVLAAVVENRATVVGLAVLNTDTMSLRMVQLIETSRSYTNVLSLLQAFRPAHLVIVASNQAINLGVNRATRASFHQVLWLLRVAHQCSTNAVSRNRPGDRLLCRGAALMTPRELRP